jgi:plasmid stability protein
MKTTLDLPDELVRAVKLRAVGQGRPMKDLVAEMLRQGLGIAAANSTNAAKPPAKDSMVQITASGLPVARCRAGAVTTKANIADLLKLEQQAQHSEDMQRVGLAL